MQFLIIFISTILLSLSTYGYGRATIAVVDSGVDFDHPSLENLAFINSDERINSKDSDRNGYVDDVSGWNFVTMSGVTFEKDSFPFFDEDFYRYYEVRRKRTLKISTEEEDAWYQEKRKDEEFQEKRGLFRRYIHGTHVAGLATGLGLKQILKSASLPKDLIKPKVLAITYLGDTETGPAAEPIFTPLVMGTQGEKLRHLKTFLSDYLKWQKNKLNLASEYANQFAHVLNASFGISYESAGNMVSGWYEEQFPTKASEVPSELEKLQADFREGLLRITKEVVDAYPQLVFVFSAGNGKDHTTVEPHYPSGVKCGHCLSVGAALGTVERAYFSNFGKTSVSLFAPGVAMKSSVPEARTLPVNGTSQAAPQVAFAAANVFQMAWDQGLFINAAMVKEILMASVDLKEGLKEDCESSGIVNPLRAVRLTKLLRKMNLQKAKTLAYKQIQNLNFLPEGASPLQKNNHNIQQEVDELTP